MKKIFKLVFIALVAYLPYGGFLYWKIDGGEIASSFSAPAFTITALGPVYVLNNWKFVLSFSQTVYGSSLVGYGALALAGLVALAALVLLFKSSSGKGTLMYFVNFLEWFLMGYQMWLIYHAIYGV